MLKTSCPKREMENMRGGKGLLHATDLTTVEECYGHVRLFCHMVLDPGASIGYHAHEGETEFFYIRVRCLPPATEMATPWKTPPQSRWSSSP